MRDAEIIKFPTRRKRPYVSTPFSHAADPGENVVRLERPPVWILVGAGVATVLRAQGHAF